MNLIHLITKVAVLIWIVTFSSCSTTPVKLQGYHLKSQADIERLNITKKLEAYQTRATYPVLRQILVYRPETKDTLFLMPLLKQDSKGWESLKPLYIAIPTDQSQTRYGHTNTVGSTLWKN